MTGRWFRLYEGLVDDPKVQRLRPEMFKALVNLWCLASRNGGVLPPLVDIAFGLRMTEEQAKIILDELETVNLVDETRAGKTPHNWSGRQHDNRDGTQRVAGAKGDPTAAKRMQRHRNRNATVTETVTPNVTEPYQEIEQIQNRTEKKDKRASAPVGFSRYAFEGKVIRLTHSDFTAWAEANSHVELRSYLIARDAWLAEQPEAERKRWFISTPADLRNKNLEAKRSSQAPPRVEMLGGMRIPDH